MNKLFIIIISNVLYLYIGFIFFNVITHFLNSQSDVLNTFTLFIIFAMYFLCWIASNLTILFP